MIIQLSLSKVTLRKTTQVCCLYPYRDHWGIMYGIISNILHFVYVNRYIRDMVTQSLLV